MKYYKINKIKNVCKTTGKVQIFVLVALLCVITNCKKATLSPQTEFVIGTVCTVNLFEDGTQEIYKKIFARLKKIDDVFSSTREDSVLNEVNRQSGIAPVHVPEDFFLVVKRALYFAKISDGAFDPSIGPLVKTWGIGTKAEHIPQENDLQKALELVDYNDVIADESAQTIFLVKQGMALDLGGIAKGFAADELVSIIKNEGVKKALIDLGGNIYVLGNKNPPWRIGIQDPSAEQRGSYIGFVEVETSSLVTSGIYERFFEEGGVRYHHILSTKTGFPVDSNIASVTIINENSAGNYISMDADALSTTLFAIGFDEGCRILKSFPNISAIFVMSD
ncbi:MAG: FAD:protein FMN transferase, partial [Spirochaetaceae bacterium]|nr:FAD:protein FMN transferase [Spirochaetaceae bacterium]